MIQYEPEITCEVQHLMVGDVWHLLGMSQMYEVVGVLQQAATTEMTLYSLTGGGNRSGREFAHSFPHGYQVVVVANTQRGYIDRVAPVEKKIVTVEFTIEQVNALVEALDEDSEWDDIVKLLVTASSLT